MVPDGILTYGLWEFDLKRFSTFRSKSLKNTNTETVTFELVVCADIYSTETVTFELVVCQIYIYIYIYIYMAHPNYDI